jgi:hypothetical protein
VLIFYASAECLLHRAVAGTMIFQQDNKAPFVRRAE